MMEGSDENINIRGNIQGEKVIVKASDILKKLRTPQDRKNFSLENSKKFLKFFFNKILDWYIPNLKGYDATFLLKVMRGEKRCLPIGFQSGFHLSYFRKGETLNKEYIINKISGNPNFKYYIPDGISPMSLTRDFLLTVSILYNILVGGLSRSRHVSGILCDFKNANGKCFI